MISRRRFGLGAAALVAAGTGGLLLRQPAGEGAEEVAARAAAIGRRYGLRVGYGDPAGFYVAPYGPADARLRDARATPATPVDVAPALDGIAESLGRYPPGFYARFCRAIFVCGTLYFGDVRGGGTYGPAWIILAADPSVGAGGIRETARLGVHHEFSSLVLPRVPWIEPRWAALLPPGWRPTVRTDDALRRTGPKDGSDGFLSPYAATSAENDFNTYAETVFGDPDRLVGLAARFPLVRQKAALLLGAYVALDPRMIATFRSLGLGDLPVARQEARSFAINPVAIPVPTIP